MINIKKIDASPSTHGGKIPIYIVDNIDNWNKFTEWLYDLADHEVSIMVLGNVYHFSSPEERRFFVLGFSKAWDVIDDAYLKKSHGDI